MSKATFGVCPYLGLYDTKPTLSPCPATIIPSVFVFIPCLLLWGLVPVPLAASPFEESGMVKAVDTKVS